MISKLLKKSLIFLMLIPFGLMAKGDVAPAEVEVDSLEEKLLAAVNFQDLEQTTALLAQRANPNVHDARGFTPLMYAAQHGDVAIARELIKHGAQVNAQDDRRDTPLKWACWNGHFGVAFLLIKNNADVHIRDSVGDTALIDAAGRGHKKLVVLLMKHKAKINDENHFGQTALDKAKMNGQTGVVILLTNKYRAKSGSATTKNSMAARLEKLNDLPIPETARDEIRRTIRQAAQGGQHPMDNSEDYLDLVFSLPWGKTTTDNLDLKHAKQILDEDHYGLDDVKEKILDFIATLNFNKESKAYILCLVGAPGIGKTSLGKSLARALGRKYVRMAVGGMHDESELRGHRRTYIGARPGRLVQALKEAQSENPVILIDEIDKMGTRGHHGDPRAAMLEVLDPEQNKAFRDNFLEVPVDLSKALFIVTANDLSEIPKPLRDRMQVIELESYSTDEKMAIAKNHLIKQAVKEAGLEGKGIEISDAVLRKIIECYALEGGVRQLKRTIGQLITKIARGLLSNNRLISITPENLEKHLGPAPFNPEMLVEVQHKDQVGMTNGLAVIPGLTGSVFKVEGVLVPRTPHEPGLQWTGQLSEVVQESLQKALSYVRANAHKYNIDNAIFKTHAFHINISDKLFIGHDGPSAGVAHIVTMVSLLTNRKVNARCAMTGAINLRGDILPIGGLKEKILAAKKSGMKVVLVPQGNKADVERLDASVTKGIKIILVNHIDEALQETLL